MNTKTIRLLFLAALVLVVLAGLAYRFQEKGLGRFVEQNGISSGPARAAEARRTDRHETSPIEIGVIGPWSDTSSDLPHLLRGMELACSILNESAVLRHPLQLHVQDDQNSIAVAAQHMQAFCENPSICAVIGGIRPGDFQALRPLAEFNRLPFLSPRVTLPTDRFRDSSRFSFSLGVPHSVKVKAVREWMIEHHLKSVVVLGPTEGLYGHSFCNAFDQAMPRDRFGEGGIVDRALYNVPLNSDLIETKLRDWIERLSFDTFLISGDASVASLVFETVAQMDSPPTLLLTENIQRTTMNIPSQLCVYQLSSYDPEDAKAARLEFVKRFRQAYGEEPDELAAQGYDTLHVLAAALRTAHSTDPDRMADALQQLDFTQNVGTLPRIAFDTGGSLVEGRILLQKVNTP